MTRLDSAAQRLQSWLASPRATVGIVIVSVLIVASSLGFGLASDDYWHKVVLAHDPAWSSIAPRWHNLFLFFDGNPTRTQLIVDEGMCPWWADRGLRIVFFRPLSAATHALDYALWPRSPWLMHAHSLAWYGVLVGVAAWVYRRVLAGRGSAWIPGLAALLYGLDHNHGTPIGWLANRNALIAAVFALGALGAHDVAARSIRGEGRGWSIASALLLAVALLGGESAVAVVGFLIAHALFLDDRGWTKRAASLVPHAVVLVAWTLVYRLGEFGVHGSGIYVEPLRSPGAFLTVAFAHLPLLLATELGLPAIDLYTFLPWSGRIAFIVASFTFLAWSAPALLRVMRAEKTARFFLVGSLLATLPACAVFPSGRLTIISGFGLIGVVALLGAALFERATWLPLPSERLANRLVRSFTIWSFGGHLLLSPLAMQVTLRQMVMLNGMLARLGAAIPTGPETVGQRMIIMNVPDTAFISYLPLGRRVVAGEQLPSRLLGLAAGQRTIELSRTDEQTIVVHAEGGFYRERTELLSRRADDPIPVGTHLHVGTIDIEIVETGPNGVPTTAAFHFPVSADTSDLIWMRWQSNVLVVTTPPRIGEHVTIPGQMPSLF